MIFDLYAAVSNVAIIFAHNLIGVFFFSFRSSFYRVSCFYHQFFRTNQSCLTMILTIPVSYASDAFTFYCIVYLLIICIFRHQTNHIRSMTILPVIVFTPYPLVHTLCALLICVLKISLVVLVVWSILFSHQQELSPRVIFMGYTCLYQQELSSKVVDPRKCFVAQIIYFLSKF